MQTIMNRLWGRSDAGSRPNTTLAPKAMLRLGAMVATSDFVRNTRMSAVSDPQDMASAYLGSGKSIRTSFFDPRLYAARARDAGFEIGLNHALVHWAEHGHDAGIMPNGSFDEAAYLEANPDVPGSGMSGIEHYLMHGRHEGRALTLHGATRSPDFADPNDMFSSGNELAITSVSGYVSGHLITALPKATAAQDFHERVLKPLLIGHDGQLGDRESEILVRIFNAPSYLATAGLSDETSDEAALEHFLIKGARENWAPSPLFDADYYTSAAAINGLDVPPETSAFMHWLLVGRGMRIVPTPRFDEAYYREFYSDLGDQDIDVFEHFALYGVWEGRNPNALFDTSWYMANNIGDPGVPAYIHYLATGRAERFWPSRIVAAHIHSMTRPLTSADFDRGLVALRRLAECIGENAARFAPFLYTPENTDAEEGSWYGLINFLEGIVRGDEYSGLMFDEQYYRDRSADHGHFISEDTSALRHFLEVGRKYRIVPNQFFDEKFYLKTNKDLVSLNSWAFEHFLLHGIYEGRLANKAPRVSISPPVKPLRIPSEARNWKICLDRSLPIGTATGSSLNARLARLLGSPVFAEQTKRALALEPLIGDPMGVSELLVAPLHDIAGSRNALLQKRFDHDHYDTVITIPWLRTGGADLVACLVAGSVSRIFPGERVLILQTDHSAIEREDWVPAGVDRIDISDILQSVDSDTAQRLLNVTLNGLTPKRIINVNSRLCWETMERYGLRLSDSINLYSYLFCWDRTPEGLWAGYPSEFYAETAPKLTGILTDTDYLKEQLVRIYAPPASLVESIYPIYSPLRMAPPKTVVVESRLSKPRKGRPQIFWAARLDRQKRFDLVVEIAKCMPDADFSCWGSALLDAAPDMATLPENLTLRESFKSYDDLGLEGSDVWLFTAEWEGLPTILIELGARGVPIVGSAVGGVPEIITADTGWPIVNIEAVDDYVAALRQAIEDPELSIQKATALQKLVLTRHSNDAYDRSLQAVFNKAL